MNILLVIVLLAILIVATHKLPLSPEVSRKTVHVGMGTICLSFPWLFSHPWQVDLLAILAVTTLLLIRWQKPDLGNVLHRIERLSFGELLFPIGVALVFRLSKGDLSTYLPAIGILTFADTAGALIGRRFGKHPYRTNAGQKSLEGSLAVFIISFGIVLLSGVSSDPPTAILIALVVSLGATMAEGVLGAGTDNLVLPIAVFALIFLLRDLTWPDLLTRITLIAGLSLLLFCVRKLTSLNGGGLLSATIFAYLCFTLGGPHYLIAPSFLFLVHLITTRRYPKLKSEEHSADSISAIALPGLVWVTISATTNIPQSQCYLGFCLTITAHAAFLHSVTRAHLNLPSGLRIGALKVTLVALTCGLHWITPIAALTLIFFIPHARTLTRLDQAILAFLFSLPALIT